MTEKESKNLLDIAIKSLEKEFGIGAVVKGDEAKSVRDITSSGSIALNNAICVGGYPDGSIIEVYGNECTGKTTLGLHAIAETQKKGKLAAFIDVEHGLELEYAEGIGVDTSTLYFSQPMHAREALTIVEELLKTGEFGIIVLDSIAALITEQELEGHVGDAHVAPLARLMSSFLKRISGLSRKTGTIVMFINQIRTDVGKMFGDPEVTPGGKALKFYATLRLNIKSAEKLKDGVEIIGNAVKVKIVKNKVGPPFKVAVFDLVFGKGIDSLKEVIELAVQKDFIIKSGAWYKFELDGEEKSFQGLPQLRKWFEENPTWYEFIYNKVCENDG